MWQKNDQHYSKNKVLIISIILFVGLATLGSYLYFRNNNSSSDSFVESPGLNTEVIEPVEVVDEVEKFDSIALQTALDEWAGSVSGKHGVTISDVDGNILAKSNPDQDFFAASIYKLYVAYEVYKQLDAGLVDPSESYINGNSRLECLDLMIRESDSTCAEKLWNEIGKQEIEDAIISYGITDTSMTGLSTTASDAAKMLKIIYNGEGLTDSSHLAFMESMKTQIYRDTLNKSFVPSTVVYNKIGFNGLQEYHDTAIVEFDDGRALIVSVLTNGVGTKNIIRLGTMIEDLVNNH